MESRQQLFQNTQTTVEVGESGISKTNLTDDSSNAPHMFTENVEPGGSNTGLIDDADATIPLVNEEITEDEEETTSDIIEKPRRTRIPNKQIFNEDFVVYQATLCRNTDPATVADALSSDNAEEWKRAMEEEIQAHVENQTWTFSDVPAGRKAIKCKWVFKTKLKADGTVERYKARLVAKGCSQKPGID